MKTVAKKEDSNSYATGSHNPNTGAVGAGPCTELGQETPASVQRAEQGNTTQSWGCGMRTEFHVAMIPNGSTQPSQRQEQDAVAADALFCPQVLCSPLLGSPHIVTRLSLGWQTQRVNIPHLSSDTWVLHIAIVASKDL